MEYDRAIIQSDLVQIVEAIQSLFDENDESVYINRKTGFYEICIQIWGIGINTRHPEYRNEINRLICESIENCSVLSHDDYDGTVFCINDCEILMEQLIWGSDIEFTFILQTYDNDTESAYSDNDESDDDDE
jgi:hypothetical protein